MNEQKHIILTEDDRFAAKVFKDRFEGAGYRVTVALDGQSGMAAMTSFPPDLIFLDIGLPDIDGIGVLYFIRTTERLKDIPVFILSNLDYFSADVQEAWEIGATLFFNKGEHGSWYAR